MTVVFITILLASNSDTKNSNSHYLLLDLTTHDKILSKLSVKRAWRYLGFDIYCKLLIKIPSPTELFFSHSDHSY